MPSPTKTLIMTTDHPTTTNRDDAFVRAFLAGCAKDKGFAARMRRADNPATEYQSWDFLARFNVQLENPFQRLPHTTIVAAMARTKATKNGTLSLGKALAACYSDGNENKQAIAKLRRVLACSELSELCRVLRPVLALINSRVTQPLDFVRLLQQLRNFGFDDTAIKSQWAQEFYA